MYCPNCGAYNEASYNNCTSCGRYIGDINKETAQKATDTEAENQSFAEKKNDSDFFCEYEKHSANDKSFEKDENIQHTAPLEENVFKTDKKRNIYTQYTKLPKDYFVLSIICTLLGSISFGIAALIFSVMTKASNAEENYKRAAAYSLSAKRFCTISIVIGIVKYVFIWFLISFMFGLRRYYFYPMW